MRYTVIGHPLSRSLRILWAFEELGLDWDMTIAPPRSEIARAHNPSGKVPILLDGDLTVIDSVAAITYLADKHGALTYPAGSADRAQQDSFTQFACEEMDGALWTAAKHRFALPEEVRVPGVKEAARFEWARACDVLALRLGDGPFVMGETLTIPDIVIGHCAGWAKSAKFAWPDGKVGAYFKRLIDRPQRRAALAKGKAMLDD